MKNTKISNELEVSLINTIKNTYVSGFILKTIYKKEYDKKYNPEKLVKNLEKVFKRLTEIEVRIKSNKISINGLKVYLKEVTSNYNTIRNELEGEYIVKKTIALINLG